MLVSPSDVIRDLIRRNSGGDQSPYSWNAPSPETSQTNNKLGNGRTDSLFSPLWNLGDKSAGFQQPGIKLPDYVSVKGSALSVEGAITINLHNGSVYLGAGGNAPLLPSAIANLGWLPSNYGISNFEQGRQTDEFLSGGSLSTSACAWNICVGGVHAIGGSTAVELGIGAGGFTTKAKPGGSAGTGAAIRIFELPRDK
ncbi:hypothetical protein LXM60_13885 [Pandoraea sputorum]|uniref:hypothetical protein n=1 Tax=Pandoraea sputorum TaxID=93222 RepID=UPI001E4DB0DA|nr:hypothetical protein [Pandoraea sputorum]MCE4061295.1 hypothetical protein [Pandoraea sputorum]